MKLSDGTTSGYAELPILAAHLYWTRGDVRLASAAKDDPAAFFGGWSCSVTDREGNAKPGLPIPVVQRSSADGKVAFKKYATNVLYFIPLAHRFRYELRNKFKDPNTGAEYDKVVASSKEKIPGYAPNRQVFGLVLDRELKSYSPAVIHPNKWSSFISFEKAGQTWNKIDKSTPDDDILVRRYGTVGEKNAEGTLLPRFEIFGESRSTPIEAIGTEKPIYIKVADEIKKLIADSQSWAECPRWNAEGRVEEDAPQTVLQKEYYAKCAERNLTDQDAADHLAAFKGDYEQALAGLTGDIINAALESAEFEESPF